MSRKHLESVNLCQATILNIVSSHFHAKILIGLLDLVTIVHLAAARGLGIY